MSLGSCAVLGDEVLVRAGPEVPYLDSGLGVLRTQGALGEWGWSVLGADFWEAGWEKELRVRGQSWTGGRARGILESLQKGGLSGGFQNLG